MSAFTFTPGEHRRLLLCTHCLQSLWKDIATSSPAQDLAAVSMHSPWESRLASHPCPCRERPGLLCPSAKSGRISCHYFRTQLSAFHLCAADSQVAYPSPSERSDVHTSAPRTQDASFPKIHFFFFFTNVSSLYHSASHLSEVFGFCLSLP